MPKFKKRRNTMHAANVFTPATRKKGSLFCVAAVSMVAILATVGCGNNMNNPSSTTSQQTSQIEKALWVANGTNVVEFLPAQLTSGNSDPAPHLAINSSIFGAPQGVTFDASGNLWVIDGGTVSTGGTVKPALEEFTASQLAMLHSNNAPMPNVVINSASFTFPQQAVFDALGDLWVSDNMSNAVFVFTPQQLAATSSNATPSASITSTPAFIGPLGITFDASGDLFVANNGSTTIYGFALAELPTSGGSYSLTPSVILSDDGKGSIQGPWALIFDSKGNLYSSNANAPFTVVAFAPSSLNASGSPAPIVTLSPETDSGNASLASPNGIGFDNLGDLAAISSATPFGTALYNYNQLGMGGTIRPKTLLVGKTTTLNAPAGCNFGPVVN
jgi:sugar lactone lactonase YvrE